MLTPARNTNDVHIEQTDEYMAFMVLSNARYDVPTRLSTYFALAAGDAGILGAAEVNELCLSMFDLAEFSRSALWPETVEEAAASLIALLGCTADASGNFRATEVDEYEFKEASLANPKLRTLFKVMDAASERVNASRAVGAPPPITNNHVVPARRGSKMVLRTEEEELAELKRRAIAQQTAANAAAVDDE